MQETDFFYNKVSTVEVADFVNELQESAKTTGGTFDSTAADDFVSSTSAKLPENLQILLDECGDKSGVITRAILDGISIYEKSHGGNVPADLVEQALHNAYGTTDDARRKYHLPALDSASSNSSDSYSLQPNRAVVAILSMFSEAIPFAHYLPSDISSNEARLAILQHQTDGAFGAYGAGALLDGINSGDAFISSSRIHKCTIDSTGAVTGKITGNQTTHETCDPSGVTTVLLRGRSIVYVNGQVAAREVDNSGSGHSAVSGSIKVAGTSYAIGGYIDTDTGVIALTTTPAMPTGIPVVVEAFIDYERNPALTPKIITSVNTFKLYANSWRVFTQQTIDSRTQMANELGLDPYSESVIGIQQQFANERHYKVLGMAMRLAANNTLDYDFGWEAGSLAQKTRAMIFQDFATPLGAADQQMANDTMNHGITHLYVGKFLASMMLSMPTNIFTPSGIPARPSIYRIGRLFGRFEVYYAPKLVPESIVNGRQAASVLCIGRATDVTRNPFILGDAVAPSVIPIATNADLKTGAGFYARNFTAVNPHAPSSLGCAMINITNLT
ncbi:MAG: hypothetical protein WCL34_10010 [Methylococcaceae bacterium]